MGSSSYHKEIKYQNKFLWQHHTITTEPQNAKIVTEAHAPKLQILLKVH
jgi:hypothetical protein